MVVRVGLACAIALSVAGCMTDEAVKPAGQLAASKQSAVLLSYSMPDENCRWFRSFTLDRIGGGAAPGVSVEFLASKTGKPNIFYAEPGRYAFTGYSCSGPDFNLEIANRVLTTRPGIRLGGRPTSSLPLATFEVLPGEYVNIGQINVAAPKASPGEFAKNLQEVGQFFVTPSQWLKGKSFGDGQVSVSISDLPPGVVARFSTDNPQARPIVTRLMK